MKFEDITKRARESVVGQDQAIDRLTIHIIKHILTRCARQADIDLKNTSVSLVLGSSGTGKTFLTKTITEILNIPFIEINGKSISQEGWSGTSFIDLLEEQLVEIKPEFYSAVVVLIDEIDKVCIPNISSGGEDVNFQVQSSILKYIDGMTVIPKKKGFPVPRYSTEDFCFILAGNFQEIRNKRKHKTGVGFLETKADPDKDLRDEVIKFGMIPELAGRVSSFIELNPLTTDNYRELFNNSNGLYKQWQKYLGTAGLNWTIENKDAIIKKAGELEIGARGLQQEINKDLDQFLIENIDKIDLNQV